MHFVLTAPIDLGMKHHPRHKVYTYIYILDESPHT